MPEFPDDDASVAEAAAGYRDQTGIGAFLGIVTDDVGPGTMCCSVAVRDDLLNPFGVMHGGVVVVRIDVSNHCDDATERLVALAQGTVSLQTPRA